MLRNHPFLHRNPVSGSDMRRFGPGMPQSGNGKQMVRVFKKSYFKLLLLLQVAM
jgi:hypothetical protein